MVNPKDIKWKFDDKDIDWHELYNLYKIAPLGTNSPDNLKIIFAHSRYKCFIYDKDILIGVGRALADGASCSYIGDVAVHPDYQGKGFGKQIMKKLIKLSEGHNKIILYANIGKEGFYHKLGFRKMKTAMAIFKNEEKYFENGQLER